MGALVGDFVGAWDGVSEGAFVGIRLGSTVGAWLQCRRRNVLSFKRLRNR